MVRIKYMLRCPLTRNSWWTGWSVSLAGGVALGRFVDELGNAMSASSSRVVNK